MYRCIRPANLFPSLSRCSSTLSQIRLPKPSPKKSPTNLASIRRKAQQDLDNINYIRSLLNKKPKDFIESDLVLEKYLSIVTAITVSESINLDKYVEQNRLASKLILVPGEVLNVNDNGNDIMILSNGTIVGWGVNEKYLVENFSRKLDNCVENKYNIESDEFDWIDLKNEGNEVKEDVNSTKEVKTSFIHGEIMVIQSESDSKKLLEKAAFAIGLSRTTRLAVLETALEEHLQLFRIHSENLSKGIKLKISESEVIRLIGRLFLLRGKLNLYSELIETPDLYWAEPTLEKIYDSISKTLDISPRISILNRKLDYATEESRALLSVLNEKKGTRLEWIIIILITVEVFFEIERRIKELYK